MLEDWYICMSKQWLLPRAAECMGVNVDFLGPIKRRMICGLQEKPEGKVAEVWGGKLSESGLATIDVGAGLANVFAPKDKDELQNIRRSAFLSATVMRAFAVPTLESELTLSQSLTTLDVFTPHAATADWQYPILDEALRTQSTAGSEQQGLLLQAS